MYSVFSQEQRWVDAETYGSGSLYFMEPDGHGNFILIGEFGMQIENQIFRFPDINKASLGADDVALIKVDSNFKVIAYNYLSSSSNIRLNSLVISSEECFISYTTVKEVFTKEGSFLPSSELARTITCFDKNLNLLWSKEMIDSLDCITRSLAFCGVMGDKAIVAGSIHGFDVQQPSATLDSTLIRSPDMQGRAYYFLIDSAGYISDLTYIGKHDDPYISSIKRYDEDVYYNIKGLRERVIINEELVYTGPIVPRYGSSTSLVKMDTASNVEWLQLVDLDGWGQVGISAMDVDSTENVLLAVGYSSINSPPHDNPDRLYIGDSFIARENRSVDESSNVALARLNSKGEVQWLKKLWSYGGRLGVSTVICKSPNHYLVFGYSSEQLIYDGDTLISTYSVGRTAFILELDSIGNKISFEMLGGNGSTFSAKMLLEKNGDLVIAGNTYSGRVAFGDVSIEPEDVTDPSTFFNFYIARKSIRTRGSIPKKNIYNDISLYPNPASGYIQVDFQQDSGAKELYIYDALAREILYQRADEDNLVVDVRGLASGSYIVNIVTTEGSYIKKLLITRW